MNPKKLIPLAIIPFTGLSAQNEVNIDTRPNIILFMVDDMGWQDTSLTQLLKNSGYHTIHCGKAHWGAIDRDMRFYQKYIDAGLSEKEAGYASLIEGMDKSLGDLMNWLDTNQMANNTTIIFMSDNGGLSSESGWRDLPLHTHNAPLNSGKGSAYEGGVFLNLSATDSNI